MTLGSTEPLQRDTLYLDSTDPVLYEHGELTSFEYTGTCTHICTHDPRYELRVGAGRVQSYRTDGMKVCGSLE